MKKRLLLVLVVGISFSPAVFAGEIRHSGDTGAQGSALCSAGLRTKDLGVDGDSTDKGSVAGSSSHSGKTED